MLCIELQSVSSCNCEATGQDGKSRGKARLRLDYYASYDALLATGDADSIALAERVQAELERVQDMITNAHMYVDLVEMDMLKKIADDRLELLLK